MSTHLRRNPLLLTLVLGGAALAVGLAGWVRRVPAAPAPVLAAARAPAAAPASPDRSAAPIAPPPATPAAPTRARDFLAAYHGARWGEIEPALRAAGLDLDQPYVFTPWEEVASEFEEVVPLNEAERAGAIAAVMVWPGQLTAGWVRDNFPLGAPYSVDEADLAAVETLTAQTNLELEALADEWAQRIDQHLVERWHSGDFTRAPFSTAGLAPEVGFFSTSHAGYGWAMTMTLRREDYPDMAGLEQQTGALRDRRDELVFTYLQGHCLR